MLVLSSILLLAIFDVFLFFTLSYYIFPNQNSIGIHILTFCVMYIAFYFQLHFFSKFYRFRVFTLVD